MVQHAVIAGRYRLLELVGRGGMGLVWRAHDELLHREVAVKQVVPPNWLATHERDELRSRALREGRAAARLAHPNVVRVYDVVRVDDDPWLVMEYVPARSLQEIVDTDGPVDPRRAAGIGLAVLAALRAAHAAGVLHRDVKPANVLLARDGRVLLTDFGLAVFDGGDGLMTRPGLVLGSPQYVAPERAAEGVSSVETDLWSLGATLHAAVEGRSPYARSSAMATLAALAGQPPDPAPHAGALASVLAGLLDRDPRHRLRYDDAARLLEAAVAGATPDVVSGSSTGATPPTPPGPAIVLPARASGTARLDGGGTIRQHREQRRAMARRWGLVAGAVVLAVIAGVGTALAVTGSPEGRRGEMPPPEALGPAGPGLMGPRLAPPPAPPPFPCMRPYAVGRPVTAGSSPADAITLPTGWVWYGDGDRFRVGVPAGWQYLRSGNTTCLYDPNTRRTLSIEPYLGSVDPVGDLRSSERDVVAASRLVGYEQVRLAPAGDGAEWECRWTAPYGERLHALRVLPGDGGGWTLGWITSDADWAAAAGQLAVIRRSFRPGGPTR